jgi:hypothetical protein
MIKVEFVLKSGLIKMVTIKADDTMNHGAKAFMEVFNKTEFFLCYDVVLQTWSGVRPGDVSFITYGAL